MSWDVTDAATDILDGLTTNEGWRVSDADESVCINGRSVSTRYSTSEASQRQRPELVVNYSE